MVTSLDLKAIERQNDSPNGPSDRLLRTTSASCSQRALVCVAAGGEAGTLADWVQRFRLLVVDTQALATTVDKFWHHTFLRNGRWRSMIMRARPLLGGTIRPPPPGGVSSQHQPWAGGDSWRAPSHTQAGKICPRLGLPHGRMKQSPSLFRAAIGGIVRVEKCIFSRDALEESK